MKCSVIPSRRELTLRDGVKQDRQCSGNSQLAECPHKEVRAGYGSMDGCMQATFHGALPSPAIHGRSLAACGSPNAQDINRRSNSRPWAGIAVKLWNFLCLIAILLLLPIISFAQTITLSALEKDPNRSSWTLYFVSDAPGTVHQFILSHPERLVIDFTGAQFFKNKLSEGDFKNLPIKKIRSSPRSPQNLRVVLDLTTSSAAKQIQVVVSPQQNPSQFTTEPETQSKQVIIVIDPGHGGKDPGATGLKKIHEKDVVLNISKKLQALINRQPGFKAVLTRDGDYYLTLRQRLEIARQNKADMFIAIHADAYPDPLAHGVSVFALSQRGATSEAARWLAARENQSELMGGVELSDKENVLRSVLINLSQTATIQASLLIGQNMLDNLHALGHLHHNHVEQAAFVVLKSPDIPSLLVETGFISNSKEEQKLNSASYQDGLAYAMMAGIRQYFTHHTRN